MTSGRLLAFRIEEIHWSFRVYNVFHNEGMLTTLTLGELARFSKYDLLDLPGFGQRSLEEVEKTLSLYGLRLDPTEKEILGTLDIVPRLRRIVEKSSNGMPHVSNETLLQAADEIDRLRAGNAELLEAAIAFESNLSDYCDGPERDRLRAAIGRAKGERHG